MRWTCVAEDVRQGKAGKLPNDKLIGSGTATKSAPASDNSFMDIPEGSGEEIPF